MFRQQSILLCMSGFVEESPVRLPSLCSARKDCQAQTLSPLLLLQSLLNLVRNVIKLNWTHWKSVSSDIISVSKVLLEIGWRGCGVCAHFFPITG